MKKILALFMVLLILSVGAYADELTAYFIDVGSGDATVFADGKNVLLIDVGTESYGPAVLQCLLDYQKNFDKDDELSITIIGTHNHDDHIGGMNSVLSGMYSLSSHYSIIKLIMRDVTGLSDKAQKTISNNHIVVEQPINGEKIEVGNITATLYFEDMEDNDSSIVAKVEYKNISILMAADAEEPLENALMEKGYDLRANVLKVGHHGSNTSTSQEWLDYVFPEYAIISVGLNDSYGNPSYVTIDSLNRNHCNLWQTRYDGTIVLTSDGNEISVRRETENVAWKDAPFTANRKTGVIHLTSSSHVKNMSSKNKMACTDPDQLIGMLCDDGKHTNGWCKECKSKYDKMMSESSEQSEKP